MTGDLIHFVTSHSKWVYVILVYQSFLFALLLFFFGLYMNSRPKRILSLFMLVTGFIFLAFLFRYTGRIILADVFRSVLPGGFLLLMPLMYLYLKTLRNATYKISMLDLMHFIPGAGTIIAYTLSKNYPGLPYLFSTTDLAVLYKYPVLFMFIGQFAYYSYYFIRYLIKEKGKILQYIFYPFQKRYGKVLFFLSFGLYSLVLNLMVIDDMVLKGLHEAGNVLPYSIGFIILTLLIGLLGVSQRDEKSSKISSPALKKINFIIPNLSFIKGGNSHLTNGGQNGNGSRLPEKRKQEILRQLKIVINEKIYLDSRCSIDFLAKKTGTNSKYISQVINEDFGESFLNYINKLRIEEAKSILEKQSTRIYSIEGVGNMVGFQSKSTFNNHFKKFTGMTPSQYLKKLQP
jgi:AraC-like DNA-binding protein